MNDTKLKLQQLKQFQILPLDAKIKLTLNRIKEWHTAYDGNVYLAFSGGKDSTVLKHIIDTYYPDIPSVFCNTGLEYPEVRRFATSQKNVTIISPKMKFKDVLQKYGYPVVSKAVSRYIYEIRHCKSEHLVNLRLNGDKNGKFKIPKKWKFLIEAPFEISPICCQIMKKQPFKTYQQKTGRKPIIATMAEESSLRLTAWLQKGCNAFDAKNPRSAPISFWTEQDILQYIDRESVPIASVYGEVKREPDLFNEGKFYCSGLQRTGCMFCMFGVHLEEEPNRFQRMKVTHPRQYDFCMNELGLKQVLETLKVKIC